eukprot:410671_1
MYMLKQLLHIFLLSFSLTNCVLDEIGHIYVPNADIDAVQSISIDLSNKYILTANIPDGTIDVISYDVDLSSERAYRSTNKASLAFEKKIDIKNVAKNYLNSDLLAITSITHSSKGYFVATLIPQ